jgi:bifunctional ADP-heptose synthase (sugar kinase/adenylyltransferase)
MKRKHSTQQAFVVVANPTGATEKILGDAINLTQSVCSNITIVAPISYSFPKIKLQKDILFRSVSNDQTNYNFYASFLDYFQTEEEIFITVIGNSDPLAEYIKERILGTAKILNWEIIDHKTSRLSIVEHHRSLSTYIPLDTRIWISNLVGKYGQSEILSAFDSVKDTKVATIGETILDSYVQCDALGKVSKDPLVAFKRVTESIHLGGILASANNIRGLGGQPIPVTECSSSIFEQITNLQPNLETAMINIREFSTAVTKIRFVDSASGNRVFEVYQPDDLGTVEHEPDSKSLSLRLSDARKALEIADGGVVIDFGHGFMTTELIDFLRETKKPMFVNAQINAGNRGSNPVSRYRGFDHIFLNGGELEGELRRRSKDVHNMADELGRELGAVELFVTQGSRGLVVWNRQTGISEAPAFAPIIRDRVGAGDALLSTIATLRLSGVPTDIAVFYGNMAGAMLVGGLGNEVSLTAERCLQEAEKILHTVLIQK